jgi:glucan endo-1,3-alpha-glucosidase
MASIGTSVGNATAPRSRTLMTAQIHVTMFLTERAILIVTQGNARTTRDLPAGMSEVAVPSIPGTPRFTLIRNGKTIADKTGEEPIRTNDFSGAFNYFSGSSAQN